MVQPFFEPKGETRTLADEEAEQARQKKRKQSLVSVSPTFAKQHPEAVEEIDGKFYRPGISAEEARQGKKLGLSSLQMQANKLLTGNILPEQKIEDLPSDLWGPGSEGLPKLERARLRKAWLIQRGFKGFAERRVAVFEKELAGLTPLERMKVEAQGGFGAPEKQLPPPEFRGDVARWEQFAFEAVGSSEEAFQAWKESGLTLASFLGGVRFGQGEIEKIGLDPHVGYNLEKLKPWFEQITTYKQYNFENDDIFRKIQMPLVRNREGVLMESPDAGWIRNINKVWVRGAQLGLSAEQYISLAQAWAEKYMPTKQVFPVRGAGGEVFGERESFITPSAEAILAEMPDKVKYLLGIIDEPPVGFKSIPMGEMISEAPGGELQVPRQTDQDWLTENFPSIAEDRGGARPAARGFGDIFTGRGRFAPRVKTLTF